MAEFWKNVAADLTAAAIIAFIALLFGYTIFRLQRRSLNQFFGIRKRQNPLVVYLSSLPLTAGDVRDRSGAMTKHEGVAIPGGGI